MKEVRERIMKGYRPTIPAAVGTPSGVKNVTGGLTHPPDALLLDILQVGSVMLKLFLLIFSEDLCLV